MSISNTTNFNKAYNVPQPQLNSSDRTAQLKSKTKYAAAVNLAKNGGVLTKRDGSKYMGTVQTTSTTMVSASSYSDLLDVTKGKYLLTPPPSSNLSTSFQPSTGDVYYGNFTVTNYSDAQRFLTMEGYPTVDPISGQPLYPNMLIKSATSVPAVTTPNVFNSSNIVVDPYFLLFYDINSCGARSYLQNVRIDPSIDVTSTDGSLIFSTRPYNQEQAQRIIKSQAQNLRGFQYPSRVHFDLENCDSKPSILPVAPDAPVITMTSALQGSPPFTVTITWLHGFDGGSPLTTYKVYTLVGSTVTLVATLDPKKCLNTYTLTGVDYGTEIWVTASNCVPKDTWDPAALEPSCTTLTSDQSNHVIIPLPLWTLATPIVLTVPLGVIIFIGSEQSRAFRIPAPIEGPGTYYSISELLKGYVTVTQAQGTTNAYLT